MAKKSAAPKPSTGGQYDEPEIEQAEKDAVKKLLGQIERAKTLTKTFNETTLPQLRRLSWGTSKTLDNQAQSVRTNLIFATAATLMPHIYAKNPEIAVAPTEAVGENEYEKIKAFCKTAQVALNNMFVDEAKLKRRAKANLRSAMGTSVGWLKLSYQESLKGDPLILSRANDLQDNLSRIEHLIACSKKETDQTRLNQQREELKLQYQAITDSDEVRTFKGFVIDRVKTEDMFILDESVREFDDYVHAKKIAHRVWMTDDDYKERYGRSVEKSAASYGQPAAGDVVDELGAKIELSVSNDELKQTFRAVYEVWDHTTNTVCEVCEGSHGYGRAPRRMDPSPERWFPFYALGFNVVEGRWRPLADVELLEKLQDEYNTTRFLYAEARKEAIPIRIFRKGGGLTEEDVEKLTHRRARDFIGVEGNPTQSINADVMQMEGVRIDPAAYDVTVIRNDMDMMVGLSDASRSNLIQAKTATEAEIMRQSLMTRVAERQDASEDMIGEMALSCLEMMLQKFSRAEIQQIVGEDAAWPEQPDLEDIFRKIRVTVKAGTSGRANMMKERESWAQIMPIINETMTQVAEMRATGHTDLADAKVELLKETFARYDEKMDVDRFLPRAQEGGTDPAAAAMQQQQQQQMAQQLEQAAQQAEQMQQEIAGTKDALTKCEQQLAIAKNNEQAKIAEAETKRAIETARTRSDVEIEADRTTRQLRLDLAKHKMTLRSNERMKRMELGIAFESSDSTGLDEYNALSERVDAIVKPAPAVIMGPNGLPEKVRTPEGEFVVVLDANGLPASLAAADAGMTP